MCSQPAKRHGTKPCCFISSAGASPRRPIIRSPIHPWPTMPADHAGMLCVVAEVTERVIGERQFATLRDLGSRLAAASTRAEVMSALGDMPVRGSLVTCLSRWPISWSPEKQNAALAAVHGLGSQTLLRRLQSIIDRPSGWPAYSPLDVAAAGPAAGERPRAAVAKCRCDHWQKPPNQALIAPITSAEGGFAGRLSRRRPQSAPRARRRLPGLSSSFSPRRSPRRSPGPTNTSARGARRRAGRNRSGQDRVFLQRQSRISHAADADARPARGCARRGHPCRRDQRERLEIAHRNALRLLRLVNSLLDFSRIEAGRVEASYRPTDLAALTADLASSFRSATDKAGFVLIVDTPPSSPAGLCRSGHVGEDRPQSAFERLQVHLRGRDRRGAPRSRRQARLTVRDTGTGIPAAQNCRNCSIASIASKARKAAASRVPASDLRWFRNWSSCTAGEITVESEVGRGTPSRSPYRSASSHLPAERVNVAAETRPQAVRASRYVEEALRWLPGEAGRGSAGRGRARATAARATRRWRRSGSATRAARRRQRRSSRPTSPAARRARLRGETVADGERRWMRARDPPAGSPGHRRDDAAARRFRPAARGAQRTHRCATCRSSCCRRAPARMPRSRAWTPAPTTI
jgi:hypothetical protein